MFDLTGRVVVVTGAAGRLGSAMARSIVAAGAELVVTGRRESALESWRAALSPAERARCHVVVSDVTREPDIEMLRAFIENSFGALHGLVNNAHAGRVGALETITPADFNSACQYNLVAPFMMVKVLGDLLETGAHHMGRTSSVVNVASMYGSVSPDPSVYGESGKNNPVHYGATKGGLIQMTRYLAVHLSAAGIRVNSISPGPFPDAGVDPGIPDFYSRLASKVPLGRIGEPQEVAGPVVFLLSDAASYVTGVNLPVDGGWTAW